LAATVIGSKPPFFLVAPAETVYQLVERLDSAIVKLFFNSPLDPLKVSFKLGFVDPSPTVKRQY